VAITNGYCTLAEAKSALGITDSSDDTLVEGLVTAASRLVDGYTERFFFNQSQTRYFTAQDAFNCPVSDLVSVTTLATDDSADDSYDQIWTAADYQLEPSNAALESPPRPYQLLTSPMWSSRIFPEVVPQGVKVIGVWGWSAVPEAIKQATILLTTTLYASRGAPFGVLGTSDGAVFRLSSRLHPAAVALMEPYRRRTGVAR
jgi:hypothetical protein